ncbi:MAG TPA: outer membrane beta-barrel protein [Nitrospira sp.]|nr:outer membrane beta-barrel protein [Nitrospira sp.]
MRRIPLRTILSLLILLLAHETQAQDGKEGSPIDALKAAEQAFQKRVAWRESGLHFFGYLEGSYSQNFNNPSNRINQLRIFDVQSNQVRPNLAQFVLEKEANPGPRWNDRLGFRVKFNAGRDSDFIGGTNLSTWADFQEFYAQYVAPIGNGVNIQLGQINSVVGYETVESPRNPNYSRSWLFGLGQPFTTRGGRLTYAWGRTVTLSIGIIGYVNSARADTQHDPLSEAAVVFAPSDNMTLAFYSLVGPRSGPTGTKGGMLVLSGGYVRVRMSERASAVFESYYANQTGSSLVSPAGNARWNGAAAYLIYDLTKQWGLRFRAELFEDAGGFVTCQGTTDYQPRANVCFGASNLGSAPAVAQTLWEVTSTLQYSPIPTLITRLEYRYDRSDHNTFQVGGRPAGYQPTLSLAVSCLF